MSAVVFLLIALVISAVGTMVVVVRNRTPRSLDSGIDDFRREMQALAPRAGDRRNGRNGRNGDGGPDGRDGHDDDPARSRSRRA